MKNQTDSKISKMKRPNHNVYGLSQRGYSILSVLGIVLWILLLFEIYIRTRPMTVRLLFAAAILFISVMSSLLAGAWRKIEIKPYSRVDGFSFLGLHDLKNDGLENKNDVLPRNEEVEYINSVLEKTIFPQDIVKQALCLTGPSGSGKSTILSFFKQTYGKTYQIYDFSGNYRNLEGYLSQKFTSSVNKGIDKSAYHGKVVFILDQFERFFFLSEEDQQKIRNVINTICMKNTAVIVSLREEYLADFLKQFDMNNLKSPEKETDREQQGILKNIVSVIEKKQNVWTTAGRSETDTTIVWDTHRIKDNAVHYLNTKGEGAERSILNQMGATLLYCQNQNELNTQIGRKKAATPIMGSKCETIFSEKGKTLFDKHSAEPLIEQQIIFHMAEFNKKIHKFSYDELDDFINKDNNELLDQYYDIQLASCPSFFHSSRILYLLSQARLHQLSIKTQDIEDCLFPDLLEPDGHQRLTENIEHLQTLQLIRENTEGSTVEYEIAHDFIAKTFLNYCATNMHRGVKTGLDIFISEYQDEMRRDAFKAKIEYRKKVFKDRFIPVLNVGAMVVSCLIYLLERFVYNPWTTVWQNRNPYGAFVPAFPLFITCISLVYIYCIYNKIAKYYRGNKQPYIKPVYLLLVIAGVSGVFCYPHFLAFLGADLAFAAIFIGYLLESGYRQSCRNELKMYGLKSFAIGLIFAAAHIFLVHHNPRFEDFMIIAEFFMFTILAMYAMIAHLTQEYIFSRMIDASSEKL